MISADLTVAQLARQFRGAATVLYQHQLDLRDDGNQTLAEIAEDKAINLQEFLYTLQKQLSKHQSDERWQSASDAEIIQHIQTHFHSGHRQLLPELIHLARRVETVHKEHRDCPLGLAQQMHNFQVDIEQHTQKEELVLFPMLLNGHKQPARQPIEVMQQEHASHDQSIDKIYELTNSLCLPQDACNTWQNLYVGLYKFLSEFKEHMHLENNILFPRAEAGAAEVNHG
ncbi:MAG: hemerythrin domain-containing protein [Kangiellaceae bacterium]|nr:hemerythrin domain-containing protein [Kangiellaceae bacterium]